MEGKWRDTVGCMRELSGSGPNLRSARVGKVLISLTFAAYRAMV